MSGQKKTVTTASSTGTTSRGKLKLIAQSDRISNLKTPSSQIDFQNGGATINENDELFVDNNNS